MSKVIKKFRKDRDYDEFSMKTAYDSEFRKKKLETKQKTKQIRDRRDFIEVGNDDFDDSFHNRRY